MMHYSVMLPAALLLSVVSSAARGDGTTLVDKGVPLADIVLADRPSPMARYAAQELQVHIAKATGVTLEIATDARVSGTRPRIFVGFAPHRAEKLGVLAEELGPDESVLRTVGRDLYVFGKEGDDVDPLLESCSTSGTLFGVYEVLGRSLGVRWLWPGELGTYVPGTDTVVVENLDERIRPALAFRIFRWRTVQRALGWRTAREPGWAETASFEDWKTDKPAGRSLERIKTAMETGLAGFTERDLHDYGRDLAVFMRRHRVGGSDRQPWVGHRFADWWEKYGEEHPEWFMLNADGERGLAGRTRHIPMCVSNGYLHEVLVGEVRGGADELSLGEVDADLSCSCRTCREWDRPQPRPFELAPEFYPSVSNRYARFWQAVSRKALQVNPAVRIKTFLYHNYLPAPTAGDIELGAHVYAEFVGGWGGGYPADYHPVTGNEALDNWIREQWLGWKALGMTLAYRPNYMNGGYVMPWLNTRRTGDFLRFAFRNGMAGVDIDSLTGQWAAQGPMLYVHFRLMRNPERAVDAIRREFFSAFGPAAAHVEAYFHFFEDYSGRIDDIALDDMWSSNRSLYSPVDAANLYPPEVLAEGRKRLEKALDAVRRDANGPSEYAARVEFLLAGLEHARLSAEFMGSLGRRGSVPGDPGKLLEARKALKELIAFRRKHARDRISDFLTISATREVRRVAIQGLLDPE